MRAGKNSALIMRFKTITGTVLFLSALFFVSISTAVGAEFWETKDYTQWTDKECARLLTDSPWAQKLELVKAGYLGNSEGAEGQSYVRYNIILVSALPIRQAQVRQAQIANKYDSLSAEQKQAFDKQTEGFLAADYSDKIVVNISYSTNVQQLYQDLARYWQSQTTQAFSNSVFLVPGKGERAQLMEYKPPQGASRDFTFIFPREVKGNPLLSDQDKGLSLEFTYPPVGFMGDGRGFIEFKVKKMMIKGGIIY
jgi:hypothetical protein